MQGGRVWLRVLRLVACLFKDWIGQIVDGGRACGLVFTVYIRANHKAAGNGFPFQWRFPVWWVHIHNQKC